MPTFSNTRANVEMVIPHLKEAEDYCGGGARIKCIRDIDDCNIQERRFTYCDEDGACLLYTSIGLIRRTPGRPAEKQ